MKKIIVTVVAVGFAAIAAQAQSPGVEARIMADAWNTGKKKNVQTTTKTTTTRPAATTQNRQAQQMSWLERAIKKAQVKAARMAQDKDSIANQANTQNTTTKPATKQATGQKKADTQAKTTSSGVRYKGSFWAALVGGRYPGESDADYAYRMRISAYPACQPFK